MRAYLVVVASLSVPVLALAMDLQQAVSICSAQNPRLLALNKAVDKLSSERSRVRSSYGEKVSVNIYGQRDVEHLGDLVINDLDQKYFIDYTFSQTNYTFSYERSLFNDEEAGRSYLADVEIRNKMAERDHWEELLEDQVGVLFSKLFYLSGGKAIIAEKVKNFGVLKEIAKSRFESGQISLDELALLSVGESRISYEASWIDEKIQGAIGDLSDLLGRNVQWGELELEAPRGRTGARDLLRGFLGGVGDLSEKISANNEKKYRAQSDLLRTENRWWDVQVGFKYFDGNGILNTSVTGIRSFRVSATLTDNYGTGGFYKGFYGNDPQEGSLFYFNLTLGLIGNNLQELEDAHDKAVEKEKLELIRQRNELENIIRAQEAGLSWYEKLIEMHEKNVVALKRGHSVRAQKFRAGKVSIDRMAEYENQYFNEQMELFRARIGLCEKFFQVYEWMGSYRPNGYD